MIPKLKGKLYGWFETGCEGIWWSFTEDNKKGYDGLHPLEQGDYIKVFDQNNNIVFDGFIDRDHKIGWKEYPLNPSNGQPFALGYWIHWTQKGWQPDDWARLFMPSGNLGEFGLRAEYFKNDS